MTAIEQLAYGFLAFVAIAWIWYGLAELRRKRKASR